MIDMHHTTTIGCDGAERDRRGTLHRMFAVVLMAILSMLVWAFGEARAGTYVVNQCDYELGISTSAFSWQSSGAPGVIQHPSSGCGEFGFGARTTNAGSTQTYPNDSVGGYTAEAPEGTSFRRFSGMFGTFVTCCVPGMEIYAEAEEFADGSGAEADIFRGSLGPTTWQAPSGGAGPVRALWEATTSGFGAERINYRLQCASTSGCQQSSSGDMRLRARSFEFLIEDNVVPEIDEPTGTMFAIGWLRGTRTIGLSAGDEGGGLASLSVTVDGNDALNSPSSCSKVDGRYVALGPCPLIRNASWSVDTSDLPDGVHTVAGRATDAGGARVESVHEVKIDNTSPATPAEVIADGDQGWRRTNDFSLTWTNPANQQAPIAKAYYSLCPVEAQGSCTSGSRAVEDVHSLDLSVPAPGEYEFRVWLEDAAGNVDPGHVSEPVAIRFDDATPGQAVVSAPSGWRGVAQADSATVELSTNDVGTDLVSGVAGYSLSVDGSVPDYVLDVAGAITSHPLGALPEGITHVRARAISQAGVPSQAVGEAHVRVDRSPPAIAAQGIPEPDSWYRRGVMVSLKGVDQQGLSGMDPASPPEPITSGGFVALRIDGAPEQQIAGDEALVPVAADGQHHVTFKAYDAAGNASDEKEATFKIDKTAPVGAFRGQDPADPRLVRVDVEDATSGVAGGRIEYRKVGDGGFKRLDTAREGGRLSARIDDLVLPTGRYELRAVASDVAGNEAVIDTTGGRRGVTLSLPLRAQTTVTASHELAPKRCAKAKRGGKARRVKARAGKKAKAKCKKKQRTAAATPRPYGQQTKTTGRLTAGGAPLASTVVTVEGQARSGGKFATLGTTRTDARGGFRFSIPKGPSRTVRYSYAGSDTRLPATATLATKIKAAARLKVNRRRFANGQTVRFTGRLLGKPIPKAGKLVALQAKVGRGWRTFATPRANAKGAFKHRYRFTSTTGLRRYAFRAVVSREGAYPYEEGVSKIVKVTVRGR